jgi:single-stranded-DNA-specific exonuclease
MERLAPVGPGNPPLVLMVPRLAIQSSSTIGRDGDHLQVMVKDEQDNTQRVIWWRGAGWPLPEGIFDLACVVRASNYRGQRGVQVEWKDARPVVETGEITLSSPISIIDQRDIAHPLPVLQQILAETLAVVWGEVEARDRLPQSLDRSQLTPADTLIVWTTPPGRAELQAAIDRVHPKNVVIFAVDPEAAGPEAFLKRLAGLVKFALEKLDGRADLSRLSAATGQREPAVRLGLKWMEQRGMLQAKEESGIILLQAARGDALPEAEKTLAHLRALLEETIAYRRYFHTAEKENL